MNKILSDSDIFGLNDDDLLSDDDIFGASYDTVREPETLETPVPVAQTPDPVVNEPFRADRRGRPLNQTPVAEEPDPFEDESFGDLAKRRGQQAARGATEVFASVPETLAIIDRQIAQGREDGGYKTLARLRKEYDDTQRLISFGYDRQADLDRLEDELRIEAGRIVYDEGKLSKPLAEDPLFQAGDRLRDASERQFGAPDPADTAFWGKVAEGAGNLTALATSAIVTGPAALATGAGLGASMNTSSLYKEALDAGADEETANQAARWGAAIGATEIIPISRALKLLPPGLRQKAGQAVMGRFGSIAQSSGEEAAQEYLATVANNIVAQQLYDPERGWTEGATEAALVGAVLGGALGAGGSIRRSDDDEPDVRVDIKPPPQRPDALPNLKPGDNESPLQNDAISHGRNLMDQILSDGPAAPAVPEPVALPEPPAELSEPVQQAAPPQPTQPEPAPAPTAPEPAPVVEPPMMEAPELPEVSDPQDTLQDISQDIPEPEQPAPETPDTPVPALSVDEMTEGAEIEIEVGGDTPTRGTIERVTPSGPVVRTEDGSQMTVPLEDIEEGEIAVFPRREQPSKETNAETSEAPEPQAEIAAQTPERQAPVARANPVVTLTNEELVSVEADPDTFQYKSNADQDGLTERLRGVGQWDVTRSGTAIVYEYADGRRVIADGHQRLGLAKRLHEEGQDVALPVIIRREVDGYTPQEVMVQAAMKNIAESPNVANADPQLTVDAAKVMRAQPGMTADEMNLPPKSALVRDATNLRALSDDAFGMVVNNPDNIRNAAAVGKVVQDQSVHANVLGVMNKLDVKNQFEAEQVARQAAADTVTSETESLFGPDDATESLYLERARILNAAVKRLRKDQSTFRTLVEREGAITDAGNKLDQDANTQRLQEDAVVQQYLTRQANTKGPVSDALSEAAKDLKAGGDIRQAVTSVINSVRKADEGAGQRRAPEREAGPVDERQSEAGAGRQESVEAQPTTEATQAGEQQVIPGAEQSESRSNEARAADERREVDTRAQQSQMRSAALQDAPGELFDTQGSLLDNAERSDFGDLTAETPDRKFHRLGRVKDPAKVEASLSDLEKRLDRVMVRGVNLSYDPDMENQGAVEFGPNDEVHVIIGAALDDWVTLNHEVIHILRGRGLFKDDEWNALREQAQADWLDRYDIAERYADLDQDQQIEEAVAEAFADWSRGNFEVVNTVRGPFAKLRRFLKAVVEALRGQGLTSPADIFDAVDSGLVGARDQDAKKPATKTFYQFRESAMQEIDRILRGQDIGRPVLLGKMPDAISTLQPDAGAALFVTESVLWKAVDKHGLTPKEIKDILKGLENPIMVFDSKSATQSLVVLVDKATGGRPSVVAIDFAHQSGKMTVGRIKSIHAKDDAASIRSWIDEGYTRYVDKKAAGPWFIASGLQSPPASPRNRHGSKILTQSDIFKRKEQRQPSERQKRRQARRDARIQPGQGFSQSRMDELDRLNQQTGMPNPPEQLDLPDAIDAPRRGPLTRFTTEAFQDKFTLLRKAEEVIEKKTGQKLPESMSFSSKETVFKGRVATRMQNMMDDESMPLERAMAQEKVSMDDLGTYLIARHAPERNAEMARRNPDRFGQGGGSGMTDGAAEAFMKQFDEKGMTPKLEKLAAMVDTIIERDLNQRYLAGLLSKEQVDSYKKMYKHYVPLRAFAERDDGDQVFGTGAGFDMRSKENQSALGRASLSDNPVTQTIFMRQQGIMRIEKNRVMRALLKQAQKYNIPDLWENVGKLPTREFLNKETGMVEKMTDFGALQEDEMIGVKIGGQVKYLRIKDKTVARALKNLDDNMGEGAIAAAVKGLRRFTATFSRLQTSGNPDFVVPNAASDFFEGLWTAYNVPNKKTMALSFVKNYGPALYLAARDELGTSKTGQRLSGATKKAIERLTKNEISEEQLGKMRQYYKEWEDAGGRINFMAFRDVDEITREMNRPFEKKGLTAKRVAAAPARAFEGALSVIEKFNQPFESAGRLSMYISAREQGLSREQAAALSLDASGNYYRRGNATPVMQAGYAFFNPAVQGIEKLLRFSRRPRNWIVLGGVAGAAYANALMQMDLWGDDDDPEEKPLYLKIPLFERSRAIIWPTGIKEEQVTDADGKVSTVKRLEYKAIRVPHSLRPLLTLGDQMAALHHAKNKTSGPTKHTTPRDSAEEIAFSLMMNNNPMGGGDLVSMLSPTVTDPFFEIGRNRNAFGTPINPGEQFWTEGRPKSQLYFKRSTPDWAIKSAEMLNDVSGGNLAKPGELDIYPDNIEHMWNFLSGGLGRFISRGIEHIENEAIDGVETEPHRVPIKRAFEGATGTFPESERYYELREKAFAERVNLRAMQDLLDENPDNQEALRLRDELLAKTGASYTGTQFSWTESTPKIFDKVDKKLKAIRAEIYAVQQSDLPRAEIKRKVRELQNRIELTQKNARIAYIKRLKELE